MDSKFLNKKDWLKNNARKLRKRSTDAERNLWYWLRNRQLKGCKFRRQYTLGSFIVDFICLSKKLIIELDGSQHITEDEADRKRTEFLQNEGYKVIRFWDNQVLNEIELVLNCIYQELI